MRPLRFLRRNPLLVLAAFAAAFAFWVWQDSTTDPPVVETTAPLRAVPQMMTAALIDGEVFNPVPQSTAHALPRLRPGMTRTEVEGLVGPAAADDISPAVVAGGRVTYHMAYEADLGPPSTVRPVKPPRARATLTAEPANRTLVTLEFDATKPGHPLVGVHYPDPLF